MNELMLLLSEGMPIDALIDMLDEAIEEYRISKSDESLRKIETASMMICTKTAIRSVGGKEELSRKMNDVAAGMKVFNPEKN